MISLHTIRFHLIGIWAFAVASPAIADSLQSAQEAYFQSDYKSCVARSKEAAKTNKEDKELSKVLKMMGICHFMQKNKTNAASAFKSAVKHNPETEIKSDEVLDTSVIDFFVEQKFAVLTAKPAKAKSRDPKIVEKRSSDRLKKKVKLKKRILPDLGEDLFVFEEKEKKRRDITKEFESESKTGNNIATGQNGYPMIVFMPPPGADIDTAALQTEISKDSYNADRKMVRTKRQEKSLLTALLPFGAGQFQNGDQFMGFMFMGAQIAALGVSAWSFFEFMTYRDKAKDGVRAIGDATRADSKNSTLTTAQMNEKVEQAQSRYLNGIDGKSGAQAAIDQKFKNTGYGLIAFGGIWAVSAVQAIFSEPKTKAYIAPEAKQATAQLAWSKHIDASPQLGIQYDIQPQTLAPEYGVGLTIEF